MMTRWPMMTRWAAATAAAALTLSGCGAFGQNKLVKGSVPDSITVTSPAFREGARIPMRFGCAAYGGTGRTPPLRWSVGPAGVRAWALVIDDPDASGGAYVHWVLFNVDPNSNELLEGSVPQHAQQARNTSGLTGYTPPCPPKGERHRYRFTMYALKEPVKQVNGAKLSSTLAAIASRTIARGRLTVTFGGR